MGKCVEIISAVFSPFLFLNKKHLKVYIYTLPEKRLSFLFFISSLMSPDSSVGKESTCNAGDPGSVPGSERCPGEGIGYPLQYSWASLLAQLVKNPPAMRETWVQSLGWEDPLEKGKATHSSILAYRIQSLKKLDMTEWLSLYCQIKAKPDRGKSYCRCHQNSLNYVANTALSLTFLRFFPLKFVLLRIVWAVESGWQPAFL